MTAFLFYGGASLSLCALSAAVVWLSDFAVRS